MRRLVPAFLAAAACSAAFAPAAAASDRADIQETIAITDGNGDSSRPVISQDRRYSTVLAFESEATNFAAGDTNGVKDIFMVRRNGHIDNEGSEWQHGGPQLVSKGLGGAPANGPSWGAVIDGGFPEPGDDPTYPKCIGFLSDAGNLVADDTNGVTDAFVSRGPGGAIERVSLPGGRQSGAPATAVSVSIDCSHVAYVTGGQLHVRYRNTVAPSRRKRMTRKQRAAATRSRNVSFKLPNASDPSFATGQTDDLVVAADAGVYLIKDGVRRPVLVAPGGRNPGYNDVKCRVVTYEQQAGGHTQVAWRYLGAAPNKWGRSASSVPCHALNKPGEQFASKAGGNHFGNGDSTDPSIGNSGFYITFQSDASNLGVNALGRPGDLFNHQTDVYLYTAVRDLTLVQSVEEKAMPLDDGGENPSTSWYANYVFFDTPADGIQQIWMRYLGPV